MANRTFIDDFEITQITGSGGWYNFSTWGAFWHGLGCSADFIPFIEGLNKTTPGFVPHSGARCFGIESVTPPVAGAERFWDISMGMLPLTTTNEIYVSCWRFLEAGWQVANGDYSRLMGAFNDGSPNWYPDSSVTLSEVAGRFDLALRISDPTGATTYPVSIVNFPLPIGRWFQQEYFFRRDAVNGAIALWVDKVQYVNLTGRNTVGVGISPTTSPAGERHAGTDMFVPYRQWLDDLEVFDGLPAGVYYNLTLNATPINVPMTVDGVVQGNTPLTLSVPSGNHTLQVPAEVVV